MPRFIIASALCLAALCMPASLVRAEIRMGILPRQNAIELYTLYS